MTDSERITALERRVAELEKRLQGFPRYFKTLPVLATPIRTDEVTCTGEMK